MKQLLLLFIAAQVWILTGCDNKTGTSKNDSSVVFGDSIPVSNGLAGKVFLLPDTTSKLPDFDTMQSQPQSIYVKQINIPRQDWSAGFPGLHNRFEWFGIEYTGDFKPAKPGNYLFKLVSDDGSQLFIDDTLFINNDGIHSELPVEKNIYLSGLQHSIKLRYFQGPRYQLCLQLYWSLNGSSEKIFPGTDFILQAPKVATQWWIWLLIILIVIVAAVWIVYKRKK